MPRYGCLLLRHTKDLRQECGRCRGTEEDPIGGRMLRRADRAWHNRRLLREQPALFAAARRKDDSGGIPL